MSYEHNNISTPTNSLIEKHYGKGVIGPGYFAPKVWSEWGEEDKLTISPRKAPNDLYEDTATYIDPETRERKPLEIELEEPELTSVHALLEKEDQIEEEGRLEGEYITVAYGEHPMNIYGSPMV